MTELVGERTSTASLQALLDHSREGIALVDADGVTLYANPAIVQVLGSAATESVGHRFVSLIHPEEQQAAS